MEQGEGWGGGGEKNMEREGEEVVEGEGEEVVEREREKG